MSSFNITYFKTVYIIDGICKKINNKTCFPVCKLQKLDLNFPFTPIYCKLNYRALFHINALDLWTYKLCCFMCDFKLNIISRMNRPIQSPLLSRMHFALFSAYCSTSSLIYIQKQKLNIITGFCCCKSIQIKTN